MLQKLMESQGYLMPWPILKDILGHLISTKQERRMTLIENAEKAGQLSIAQIHSILFQHLIHWHQDRHKNLAFLHPGKRQKNLLLLYQLYAVYKSNRRQS